MSTVAAARQRTTGQRKAEGAGATAIIQDSQEQENEIKQLRRENDATNERAQLTLDFGVVTNLVLTAIQFASSISDSGLTTAIAAAQFILLFLSLTPSRLPILRPLASLYPYVLRVQVTLGLTAIYLLSTAGQLGLASAFRWALPATVAGGVELQRRSEKDAEARLKRLEALRYDYKGA